MIEMPALCSVLWGVYDALYFYVNLAFAVMLRFFLASFFKPFSFCVIFYISEDRPAFILVWKLSVKHHHVVLMSPHHLGLFSCMYKKNDL